MKQSKRNQLISWNSVEAEWKKDPKFVEEWKKIEPEYQLARQIIGARLKKELTQAELAKKIGTDQATISKLESMSASPSLGLIKRLAAGLNTTIKLSIGKST